MSSAPEAASEAPPPKSRGSLLPALVAIVLAPALTWAVAQFVLLPQLQEQLAAAAPAAEGAAAPAEKPAAHGKKGDKPAGLGNTYEFENMVVNLAGTMGTRYLKTSFLVTGSDPALRTQFENHKPRLIDATLNVLSALSLNDLEEAGAKNIIREKLVQTYNHALGKRVAEQVYFSDFVVQ